MGILRGTRNLLIATGIVFLLQGILPRSFTLTFSLIPRLFMRGEVWRIFTYMFLHGGFFHIFFNMYVLYLFGNELEYFWGTREFIKYYFICGAGAGFIYALINFHSYIPVLGASGAIFGLLVAYGILFPERHIIIFPLFIPMKVKHAVILFGIIEFLGMMAGRDNIAHLAHLGGLLVGYLYLRYRRRRLY
ncbi:DUF1751 domain-containing protein [bacterium]|nr:MAG: DUF1751 domain-containing protein [bacterium]